MAPLFEVALSVVNPLGILVFGSSVKSPWIETVQKRKYFFFGPVITHERVRRVEDVHDIDAIVFAPSGRGICKVPGTSVSIDYGLAVCVSGWHVVKCTPEAYLEGRANGDSVCVSSSREGVMLLRDESGALDGVGSDQLCVDWAVTTNGDWSARTRRLPPAPGQAHPEAILGIEAG